MSDDPLLQRGEMGPYRIEKKLGQGAMGGVYLGHHTVLEVKHAIKVIHPRLVGDNTLLERFLREARNTARLKHQNIVAVVGADKVDGVYYLAMEFVEGRTLDQLMREGMSTHDAVRYVHMVANALNFAHTNKLIHRDIKPANIMVNQDDIAKLMDFGLVRDNAPEAMESGEQLTMDGHVMGTPQYMPIEQWQGEGVDHRSDIYSLGVTLYLMLCRKLPFQGGNAREIFRNVLTKDATPIRQHNPDIDDELAAIVHRAIAPEKENRYQSAEDFALALEQWWDNHPDQGTALFQAPSGVAGPTAYTRARSSTSGATRAALTRDGTQTGSQTAIEDPRKSSPMPVFIAVGVVVALLALLTVYIVSQMPEPAPETDNGEVVVARASLALGISADSGTEADPITTNDAAFSVAGVATGGVEVNGIPYVLGERIDLERGMNRLEFRAITPASIETRVVFVLLDDTPPKLVLPFLEGVQGNLIPTAEQAFTVEGSVSDEVSGLRGMVVTLLVNGEPRELPIDAEGNFNRELPLGDEVLTLDVFAVDRAGNRTDAPTFWVVPDRAPLRFLDVPEGTAFKAASTFSLSGKLSKSRGVTLTVDGQEAEVSEGGEFSASVTRQPGPHEIEIVARDWLGAEVVSVRRVVVVPSSPVVEIQAPEDNSTIRAEALPVSIEVKGVADHRWMQVTVNGESVELGEDSTFAVTLQAAEFGSFHVLIAATDPAQRTFEQRVTVDVQRLLYRPAGENAQGFREFVRVTDNMRMVAIPGGTFKRGARAMPDAPETETELTGFLIAKYTVNNEQFATFLTESRATAESVLQQSWLAPDESGRFRGLMLRGDKWTANPGDENLPVVGVTWFGARAYAKWADPNGELPSEAQWEYAARGTDGRIFPWGDALPSTRLANTELSGRDATASVDSLPEGDSPFGVRMMAGNVEEWCLDWYDEGAYRMDEMRKPDPALERRPAAVNRRVVRGGSFLSPVLRDSRRTADDDPSGLWTFARGRRLPDSGAEDRGFRPVAPLPPGS